MQALLEDLKHACEPLQDRTVRSIFIGGGTPSLFSAESIHQLMEACRTHTQLTDDCEITLETNPGTFEADKFRLELRKFDKNRFYRSRLSDRLEL